MAGTGQDEATSWTVRDQRRLAALTRLLLRMHLGACLALLAVGAVAATFYGTLDGEEIYSSLLTIPGQALTDGDELSTVLGIGFVGLLLCTIAAVLIALSQWHGALGPGARRTGKVVAVLMAIGGLVPVVLTLIAFGSSDSTEPGPAMLYYAPGVALFGYVMFSPTFDELRQG